MANYSDTGLLNFVNLLVVGDQYSWIPGVNEISVSDGVGTYTEATDFVALNASVLAIGVPNAVYTGQLIHHKPFQPVLFAVYNGQVFVRGDDNAVYAYGGADGRTYDASLATVVTPWLDNKHPTQDKVLQSIDLAMMGAWSVSVSTDPASGTLVKALVAGDGNNPNEDKDATYDLNTVPAESQGTHMQMKMVSSRTSSKIAKISSISFHFRENGEES